MAQWRVESLVAGVRRRHRRLMIRNKEGYPARPRYRSGKSTAEEHERQDKPKWRVTFVGTKGKSYSCRATSSSPSRSPFAVPLGDICDPNANTAATDVDPDVGRKFKATSAFHFFDADVCGSDRSRGGSSLFEVTSNRRIRKSVGRATEAELAG